MNSISLFDINSRLNHESFTHLDLSVSMNRSPLSDFNRRRSLFDSPNLVRFINKTLHFKENLQSQLDSTTTSSSETYSTYNPQSNSRIAITRRLSNMNEQSPLQLNRGIHLLHFHLVHCHS